MRTGTSTGHVAIALTLPQKTLPGRRVSFELRLEVQVLAVLVPDRRDVDLGGRALLVNEVATGCLVRGHGRRSAQGRYGKGSGSSSFWLNYQRAYEHGGRCHQFLSGTRPASGTTDATQSGCHGGEDQPAEVRGRFPGRPIYMYLLPVNN